MAVDIIALIMPFRKSTYFVHSSFEFECAFAVCVWVVFSSSSISTCLHREFFKCSYIYELKRYSCETISTKSLNSKIVAFIPYVGRDNGCRFSKSPRDKPFIFLFESVFQGERAREREIEEERAVIESTSPTIARFLHCVIFLFSLIRFHNDNAHVSPPYYHRPSMPMSRMAHSIFLSFLAFSFHFFSIHFLERYFHCCNPDEFVCLAAKWDAMNISSN